MLGGGTPKNFINQATVQAEFFDDRVGGHRYALQIVDRRPAFRRRVRLDARRGAELGQAGDRRRAGDSQRRRDHRACPFWSARWPSSAGAIARRPEAAALRSFRCRRCRRRTAVSRRRVSRFVHDRPRISRFEYDHAAPLVFGGALPVTRSFDDARVVDPARPARSHDLVRRRHAQRSARDPPGLVAHGVLGRGARRGRARRSASSRFRRWSCHSARSPSRDGRDRARRLRRFSRTTSSW